MLTYRSDKPVIVADQPWEDGADISPVSIIPDHESDELILYYRLMFEGDEQKSRLCLARSKDGREWTKPDCGDGTNIIMQGSGNDCGWGMFMAMTILREEDESDPELRYKMMYWDRPNIDMPAGLCLAASADGIEWNPLFNRPVITGYNDAASMINTVPDTQGPPVLGHPKHLIYQQTFSYDPTQPTERDNIKSIRRIISLWANSDFTNGKWGGPVKILEPDTKDAADLQFYWLTPYQTVDGGYGGLMNCHHTIDQTMDVQLMKSKDGWSWTRENEREPILALGKQGQFDCGMVSVTGQPVVWKGKTLVVYRGKATCHDHQPRYPQAPLPDISAGIGIAEFTEEIMNLSS